MNEKQDLFNSVFKKFPTEGDREQFLEAFSIITDKLSRRIIAQAASPHTPISVNEFKDVSDIAMVRYLHLLTHVGVLKPIWDNGIKKFDISPFGREVASVIGHHP